MKRALAALLALAAWPAVAQVDITSAPCNMTDGSCAQARLVANGARSPFSPRSITKVAVSDDFNRANGSLGENWQDSAGGNVLSIATTSVVARVAGGSGFAYWKANTFSPDQYAEAYCNWQAAVNSSSYLFVRTSPGPSNSLYGYAFVRRTVSPFYFIAKVADMATTSLATCSGLAAKPIIRIEVVGSTISVYELSSHGGTKTLRCSVTDSTYTAGPPGLGVTGQYGGGYWDDFYAGDL